MKRGKLIVFEGVDGGGKSTQLKRIAAALRARGIDILETGEPTKGLWGRKIREMARTTDRVPRETELAWFLKDRREHMRDAVGPALAAGRVVLCDRSYFSTVAYQGARGFDPAKLLAESQAEFGPAGGSTPNFGRRWQKPHSPIFYPLSFYRKLCSKTGSGF